MSEKKWIDSYFLTLKENYLMGEELAKQSPDIKESYMYKSFIYNLEEELYNILP